jgi:hypothetical protein
MPETPLKVAVAPVDSTSFTAKQRIAVTLVVASNHHARSETEAFSNKSVRDVLAVGMFSRQNDQIHDA